MSNALAPVEQWDPNSGLPMPAYLTDALGDVGSNIADRMNVPSLSYEGKTWTIVKDGNKTKLQMQNSDGDMVPVPVMRLVVLAYNDDRGRAYYLGMYNPAAAAAPTCWSADGKAPDPSVKEKQSTLCTGCPMSVKGSKVTDGKEMIACSSHRMIAIAPALDLAADPLRLKIAVTSDYDKEIVEHGWYAFRQYTDWLKSRGISHTGLVVTKVKFDPNVAYPKLLFALDRLLTPDEVGTIKKSLGNPKVNELLAEKWSAAGAAGTPVNDSDIAPHGLEGAYADGWAAHPDSAGWSWKGTEVVANGELAARYPRPEPVIPPIPASAQVVENVPTASAPVVPATPAAPTANVAIAAPAASVTPMHDALAVAASDGWLAHPTSPGWWYKGEEVISEADVAAKYPAPAPLAAAPTAPAAPPAPPAAPAALVKTPIELAAADGWLAHPTSEGWWYKGEEVVSVDDLTAKFAGGNAPASPGTSAAGDPAQSSGAASTSTAAPSGASLSDIPPEVSALLNQWGGA